MTPSARTAPVRCSNTGRQQCGQLLRKNVTLVFKDRIVKKGLRETCHVGCEGDSGASVFNGGLAGGIHVGARGECGHDSFFEPLGVVLSALGGPTLYLRPRH